MTSEYTLIAINNSPIDPGDTIEIDLYWSGSGVPDENRLYMNLNRELVDQEHPGIVTVLEDQDVEIAVSAYDTGFPTQIVVPETVFHPDPDFSGLDGGIAGRISERDHDGHAPVEVRINTSRECPSGDYTIYIVFNYKLDDDIKQDRQNIDIHIRSWTEIHRRQIRLFELFSPSWP